MTKSSILLLSRALSILLMLSFACFTGRAQVMTLPPHSSVYAGSMVRGYWFTAPTNFTITALKVSPEAGTGLQSIHVFRINDAVPVLYATTSTNFTTLAYISGATNNVAQTVSIPVTAGQIIGILGSAGTDVSYSAATSPFASTIGTFPVTLNRLLYQGNINVTAAPNYSTEATGSIGRIEMTYSLAPAVCSGAPNGGTTVSSGTTINCNTTVNLSLSGNTTGSGITYQWQYNTTGNWINFGTNSATQTSPPVIQGTQFRCVVTCTNPGGSSANSTPVAVSVTPVPVDLGNDTTICPGVSYTLNAGNPGASYAWNTGPSTQSITVNAAGTYSVLVTLANGCTGSDSKVITPGIAPANNLPATTNLCSGETATLNAGNTGSTFKWTPGNATTQTINVTAAGNYSVTIKSSTGCLLTSNTNVIIRPLPVANLGNDTSICDGDQIMLDAGNTGYAYDWSTGANTQTINVSDSGTYTVLITTPYDCELQDDQHIAYLPSPRVEGFNFIPLFYEELGKVKFSPLNPTNVNSYRWNFGDNSAESTQMNPQHSYAAGGDYQVTLKVYNGCGDYEISLLINVDLTTGIVTLNGDAANIALYPNPSNNYVILENHNDDLNMQEVSVFNTVGAAVYKHKADSGKSHKLEVSSLASGIYSVRILTDKGFIVRKFEVLK